MRIISCKFTGINVNRKKHGCLETCDLIVCDSILLRYVSGSDSAKAKSYGSGSATLVADSGVAAGEEGV